MRFEDTRHREQTLFTGVGSGLGHGLIDRWLIDALLPRHPPRASGLALPLASSSHATSLSSSERSSAEICLIWSKIW